MNLKPLRDLWQGLAAAFANRRVQILFVLTGTVIGAATTFYHFQEGWHWIDALYFSVITISTVGYGDFSPQTDAGKLFTVGYLFIGLGLFVVATATFAERLLTHIKRQHSDTPDATHSDKPF